MNRSEFKVESKRKNTTQGREQRTSTIYLNTSMIYPQTDTVDGIIHDHKVVDVQIHGFSVGVNVEKCGTK